MARYSLENLGFRVKKIRKALHLSQTELADRIGMSRSFISQVEKGGLKCGYDFIYKLSDIFNVNLYYLVHGEGEMFGTENPRPSLDGKEVGEAIETKNQLVWYLERSPLLGHSLMSMATKFLYENEAHIKKEIKKFESKREDTND
jgi:transcriptional regulator with XRE-family HTH domain